MRIVDPSLMLAPLGFEFMSEPRNNEEYEYYTIHDGLGVSHVMKRKKGLHPAIRRVDCD